jgi:hypothetical protein
MSVVARRIASAQHPGAHPDWLLISRQRIAPRSTLTQTRTQPTRVQAEHDTFAALVELLIRSRCVELLRQSATQRARQSRYAEHDRFEQFAPFWRHESECARHRAEKRSFQLVSVF